MSILELYKKRPFESKILFPMSIYPYLSPIRDVEGQRLYEEFVDCLDNNVQRKTAGLYVHVPFCKSICTYCSYDRILYDPLDEAEYLKGLLKEIELYSTKKGVQALNFISINIGGGTPSTLSNNAVKTLFKTIKDSFNITRDAVFNFEVGVKTTTKEKLALLKFLGCSRVSFGIQTFDKNTRKKSALTLTETELKETVKIIRSEGFDVFFDMMYGLPGQTSETWHRDLEKAVHLNPEGLDIYCFYPLHSKFHHLYRRKKVSFTYEDEILKMNEISINFLKDHGFIQETVEDFAKPQKANLVKTMLYLKDDDYDNICLIGIGPNAYGFINNFFYRNNFYNLPKSINYLSNFNKKDRLPILLMKEASTRLVQRVNLIMFPKVIRMKKSRIGEKALYEFNSKIEALKKKELIVDEDGFLSLTDLGKLWIDNISYEFMEEDVKCNLSNVIFNHPKRP